MREYLLVLVVAAGVTYLLVPLSRALALRVGALTVPRERDVHTVPVPRLGGLALYAGFAVSLLVAQRLPALRRAFEESDVRAVLVAGAVVVVVGALDDRWDLSAVTKLAGQVAAAGLLALLGLQLLWVAAPGLGTVVLSPDLAVPLTVLLVLVTVNALNMVDGLDGLAAGVTAIAASAFFVYAYDLSVVRELDVASAPTLLCAALAGTCLGFLPHNVSPARVFMGDSGAMLLGLVLASASVSLTGRVDPSALSTGDVVPFLLPVLLPVAVLAVPLVDLLLAVVRRTRAGRNPLAADREHLHHRLLGLGHTHMRAVLLLWLWTAVLAFGGVALALSGRPLLVLAVVGTVAVVAVVLVNAPRLNAPRGPQVRP